MAASPTPNTIVPRRVREERAERGWTLDELAARSGVSRAMISKIERGDSNPTAVLLSRLADALGLSLSSLMSEPRGSISALRLLSEQPAWVDPATGYVRRLISPPGDNGDVEVVAVELPPGQRVTFAATAGLHSDDQVLLLDGTLSLTSGQETYELHPGDCARVSTKDEQSFVNQEPAPARYLIVKRHYR